MERHTLTYTEVTESLLFCHHTIVGHQIKDLSSNIKLSTLGTTIFLLMSEEREKRMFHLMTSSTAKIKQYRL